ncbi:MAG: phospholipase D-like domain-containing protein [Reyranellaceae bacterium]
MDSHLQGFIDRFKRDPDLYAEAKAKLDANAHALLVASMNRGVGIAEAAPAAMIAGALTPEGKRVQESIAQAQFRPVFVIRDNRLTGDFVGPDSAVWKQRLMDKQSIIDKVIRSVGRVEVNSNAIYNWVGTGWLIDNDVIVTNRHVASVFSQNREGFSFKTGYPSGLQSAKIDFFEEDQRSESLEFAVESVLWMSENRESEPDVAFLRVRRLSADRPLPGPIPLAAAANEGDVAITIGYPARDPDIPDQDLVHRVFGDVYDKKRLAPGEIIKVSDSELEHDCSTLGGNSGSAVIRLATGEALGLHFAGLYMEANYAVPAPKLRDLLDRLNKRTLPRLRPVEVLTSPAVATPVSIARSGSAMSGNGIFTLEASIPIKVTLEIGGAVSSVQLGTPTPAGLTSAVPTAENYDAALQVARQQLLGQPGVLDVRLGYRFRRGWITDERVIVVEVQEKQELPALRTSGKQLMPGQVLGIGVDVRAAALGGQLEPLGVSLPLKEAPRPGVYREPPNPRLAPVNERMKAIFHVSPDSGFPNLRPFIERTTERLTATMYEWEPNHISAALFGAIKPGDRRLKMVTQKAGTASAVNKLESQLGAKFDHVWASVGAGKIVPMAYHIKVACRDGKEFWLSSGNWKDSNQADIDPAGEDSTSITPLREHNREWHAIIENTALTECFESYIEWDFEEAKRVPLEEVPPAVLPDVFVPVKAVPERRVVVEYFDPLVLDRKLDITPLLTPDRDGRGKRIFMEAATALVDSARHTIDLQNQSFTLLEDNVPAFEAFFALIKKKQRQGVQTRIIFRDGREFHNNEDQQALLERLKDFGIDTDAIRVQRGCHNKGIIVDADDPARATVLFGSHNLTNTGALFNRDASLLIKDQEVAKYFRKVFNFDWETLATQDVEEAIGGVRIAQPNEQTPLGFRRVSLQELLSDD